MNHKEQCTVLATVKFRVETFAVIINHAVTDSTVTDACANVRVFQVLTEYSKLDNEQIRERKHYAWRKLIIYRDL